jgi:LuxR family maltose regulon positive regulatory protein
MEISLTSWYDPSMPPPANTVLYTKLRRPPLVTGLLPRPRLLARLERAAACTLTLVAAPAGSGKTSLVCQWLEQSARPAAWLQLDAADSDPSLFFSYLVYALRQIEPQFGAELEILLHSAHLPPPALLASMLSNEFDQWQPAAPCLLVLDDYHLVQNPEIDRALGALLLRPPHNFHLLLLTRQPPAWPLGKLRLQQQLLEISADDLRFTPEETAAYLDLNAGIPLPDDLLARLQKQMEGWAAGLQLAALNLRQTRDAQALLGEDGGLSGFVGSDNRYLLEYMFDEVLAQLPPDLLEFMYATAVCARFNAPLCQALTGAERGTVKGYLRTLRETNLFLVPLDAGTEGISPASPAANLAGLGGEGRTWYRYHHLMQQALSSRLEDAAAPAAVAELHRRAAAWLGEQGHVDEALEHLAAIGDWASAARLVAAQLNTLLNREDRRTIERWLAAFPSAEIICHPGLLLMQGWLCFFNLDIPGLAQNLAALEQARTASPAQSPPASDLHVDLDGHVILLQGVIAYFQGRMETTIAAAQRALALTPRTSTFVYGSAWFYLATALQYVGRGAEAEELASEAYRREQPKPSQLSARLLFALSSVHLFAGKLSAAYAAAELLLVEAHTAGLGLLEGWAHDTLGRIDYERNHLERAAGHFAALCERRYAVHRGCAYDGFTGAMLVAAATGRAEAVAEISAEWRSFEQSLWGLPGPLPASVRARADLLLGDAGAAQRWAAGFTAPLPPTPIFWLESSHVTKLRCLLAAGAPPDLAAVNLAAAASLAEECMAVALHTYNQPLVISLLALRALLLDCTRQRAAALDLLTEALHLAAEEGYVRSFIDLGPRLKPLLEAVAEPSLRPYLITLQAAFFGAAPGSGRGQPASAADPVPQPPSSRTWDAHPAAALTSRESEILALLATPMTLQEIGNKLFISYSTVRQHTAHIYEKLGVNKRRHAVLMAAELGLSASPDRPG